MKYAVLADIHGNREALEAVLEAVQGRGAERYLCLGDLVGYGPDPEWCIQTLQELGAATVRGNHDAAVTDPRQLKKLNDNARAAILWTAPRLPPGDLEYLRGLPLVGEEAGAVLFHGTLTDPASWKYVFTPEDARPSLGRLEGDLGFFGHSHRPGFFRLRGGEVIFSPGGKIRPAPGERVLVNPGSVGQPRDRDRRASFAVYDRETGSIEIVRVEYPVKRTQKKIRAAGLPAWLAERLVLGR